MVRIQPERSLKDERAALARGVFCRLGERTVPYTAIHRTNHRVAATLVSFLAMGFTFAAPALTQDRQSLQNSGNIRGTVINALTGEPIGRALVFTPDNRFARLTDSEGHFDYPLPKAVPDDASPPGIQGQSQLQFISCCLQARKPGFLSDSNQEQGTTIALGSVPVIALIPESVIKGRVFLLSADAASGITVEIFSRQVQDGTFHWVRGPAVRANSNGEFRFAELRPGEYKIVTHELMDADPTVMFSGDRLYGFPPVYFPGAVDFSSADPVQLKAGQTFEATLSPVRQPYYPVRIPVADDVENGEITVSVQGHDSPGYSLSFSAVRHRIEGFLPNGIYLVSMDSFQPNAASGTVILTVPDGPDKGPMMVLSRQRSIQLNVTEDFTSKDESRTSSWSDGKRSFELHGPRLDLQANVEPVGDLNLQGQRSIRPPSGPDDDALVIEQVAPGRYWLRLFASRGYVASATTGAVDLLQEPLVVSSGTSTVDVHLRDDFAEVDGSLANMNSAPRTVAGPGYYGSWKPSAYIYFVPQSNSTGQFLQTVADAEGKFHLANAAPGKYLVLAFETPQINLPYRDAEAMRIYESKGQTVRLAPGQKEKLELQVISGHD
jgi:hypothetical protein